MSRPGRVFSADVRRDALKTLVRWEAGKGNLDRIGQAFLKHLPERNRPFYTELVKGVLRHLRYLDFKLEQMLERPISSLSSWVRNILRLGGYQLEFCGIPKPVTVDLMVELSKSYGHPGVAGLVNGVLRRWSSGFTMSLPEEAAEALGIRYSHPSWMVVRWVSRFGESSVRVLLEWNNRVPRTEIRVNRFRISPEEYVDICAQQGIALSPARMEGTYVVGAPAPVESLPGFKEGFFWVQSVSAQLPALILQPAPRERVLDLCAAPGGKSCQMADLMQNEGEVVAVEVEPDRLRRIEENRRRLGLHIIRPMLADGRQIGSAFPEGSFDAALVDAPCSGTGVLRRKVDARWNKNPEDLRRYAMLQGDLLESASRLVRPGGRLVYATCSLEPEENQEVVTAFLASHPGFQLEDPSPLLPKSMEEAGSSRWVEVLPHQHGADGFFVARLTRKNAKP